MSESRQLCSGGSLQFDADPNDGFKSVLSDVGLGLIELKKTRLRYALYWVSFQFLGWRPQNAAGLNPCAEFGSGPLSLCFTFSAPDSRHDLQQSSAELQKV